jgi:hypothetical protein
MAAKSIINELYQRLRTAAPIYKTQADEVDGFLCTLTLPAVECEFEALSSDRSFIGRGCSKKVGALQGAVSYQASPCLSDKCLSFACITAELSAALRPTAVAVAVAAGSRACSSNRWC